MSATVTINATPYTVYADQAATTLYTQARVGETWSTLVDLVQKQALVSATNVFNALPWAGTKTSSTQPLALPRTGLTDADGNAIDPAVTPTAILNGYFELAMALGNDPTILDDATGTSDNVKVLNAGGGVGLEFFRPTAGSRWPTAVMAWITPYLVGGSSTASAAVGTSKVSGTVDLDGNPVQSGFDPLIPGNNFDFNNGTGGGI